MILRMALRNLIRRPMQSFLAAGAVAGGLTVILWSANFQDGAWVLMLDDVVRASAGHVVVQAKGYQESKDADLLVVDSGALADKVRAANAEVTVMRRLRLAGMIASPDNSVAVAVNGVEAEAEKAVSRISKMMVDGAWLQADKPGEVLIGTKLAKRLQVAVGDKVVITAVHEGEIQAMPFRVAGTFKIGNPAMDSFFVLASLSTLQEMVPNLRDPATQIAIQVKDRNAPPELKGQVRAAVGEGPDVLTCFEALPEIFKMEKLDKMGALFMWAFLGILASIGILNVLLMSLFQRTRELGMLQAMGMRPSGVIQLLMTEGLLLGIAGATLGFAAGLALTYPMVEYGFDYAMMQTATPVSGVALNTLMKSVYSWDKMFLWTGFHVLLAVLASLWPGVRAARLEAVECMRSQ
jgi:ABC-type lipoprotein release transport system permease subunit